MTIPKKIFLGAICVVVLIVAWITTALWIGSYYFAPTTILDSKHDGVLIFDDNKMFGMAVGTTLDSFPGEIVVCGTRKFDDVFSSKGFGHWEDDQSFKHEIKRHLFYVQYREMEPTFELDFEKGWICIWPPRVIAAYILRKHNQASQTIGSEASPQSGR